MLSGSLHSSLSNLRITVTKQLIELVDIVTLKLGFVTLLWTININLRSLKVDDETQFRKLAVKIIEGNSTTAFHYQKAIRSHCLKNNLLY